MVIRFCGIFIKDVQIEEVGAFDHNTFIIILNA